jgi:hypothetical protein
MGAIMLNTKTAAVAAATAVGACLCLLPTASSAQSASRPKVNASHRSATLSTKKVVSHKVDAGHTPVTTFLTFGEPGTPVVAFGDTPADGETKFNCKTDTCTVIVDQFATMLFSAEGSQWAIETMIDGNFINGGAYFQGTPTTTDHYHVGNGVGNLTVARGRHTVQSFVYSEVDATLGGYQFSYHITTP